MRPPWLLAFGLVAGLGACAPSSGLATRFTAARSPVAPAATADMREEGPSGAPKAPLAWAALEPATFTRAKAEGRFVVIDGAAEWCHWCHVMEATTYHDPRVRALLDARFIAVKVDVDSRPDFEERYGDWGWPATVLMTADGQELGKYRGYLAPDRFVDILEGVLDARGDGSDGGGETDAARAGAGGTPLSEEQIGAVVAWTQNELDEYWDPRAGGWGRPQKVPLAWDNAWELVRARAGDATARPRALLALDRQRAIIDPVWGGLCQYSTDGDWQHPHYEKLMTYQAGAIDNYAAAYALTHEAAWLETAQAVRGFVDHFMTSPEGAFYTTMDADLNAHDPAKPYLPGKDYYARNDAGRRALGIPRVDTHEYARDNGLAIAAYVTLFEASGDATALASAERAARRIRATHATDAGGVLHGPRGEGESGKVLYLADNAAFGFALTRLYEATRAPEHLEAARKIAALLTGELLDAQGGGFYSSTPDPDAVGVFATRRKPFEDDVMAIRFLARMNRLSPSDAYRSAIAHAIPRVAGRQAIGERGRMVGDLLLALEETKGMR
jgi:uncharacterized protein YyaL (SSP411 family)